MRVVAEHDRRLRILDQIPQQLAAVGGVYRDVVAADHGRCQPGVDRRVRCVHHQRYVIVGADPDLPEASGERERCREQLVVTTCNTIDPQGFAVTVLSLAGAEEIEEDAHFESSVPVLLAMTSPCCGR